MSGRSSSSLPRVQTPEERDYYARNAKVYPLLAPTYDLIAFPLRRLRRRIVDLLKVGPNSRVLDVATGTGSQAIAFAEKAKEVVGIDLSEAMLRIAQRKNRCRNLVFQRADAVDLPFGEKSFDVCCISFALHEMPRSVREKVIQEMARVTKPGGLIAIIDYALPKNPIARFLVYHFVKMYERDHYAEFVKSDLEGLLKAARFGRPREHLEPIGQYPALFGWVRVLLSQRVG